MNPIRKSAYIAAHACKGNPILTTLLVGLFYLAFNSLEAMVEELIFGDRFLHFLDPIFSLIAIAYAAYCVWQCAVYNSEQSRDQ